jgi:hypothetical protein
MTQKIALFAALVVLAAGCSKSNKMERGQQNYQTVEEGSASGVTSTINGPGETPIVTETNVDTTTNFTLPTNPNPLGNETAGTAFAGSVPSTATYPGMAPIRRPIQPRIDTRGMASSSAPVVTDTIGSTTPPMPKETRTSPPPETEPSTTTSSSEPPTTTTTTSTSSEMDAKAPAPKKKADDGQKSEDQQPPPPPPPPTDTFGSRG